MGNNPRDALGLNLRGHLFLQAFQITGDYEDVRQAIKAYEEAAACLADYDPRLGGFLDDIASGYQARYERSGLLIDLEKAITTRQKGVAITAKGDADLAIISG